MVHKRNQSFWGWYGIKYAVYMCIIACTLFRGNANAQQYQPADTVIVLKLLKNILDSQQMEPQRIKVNAEKALDISEKLGYKKGVASSLLSMGKSYSRATNYDKSNEYLNKALTLSRENHLPTVEAKVLMGLGINCLKKSNFKSSLSYLGDALSIFKSLNDSLSMANAYQNIGVVFMNQGQFNDGLKNYELALAIYKSKNRTYEYALLNHNIGILYFKNENYPEGMKYVNIAIHKYVEMGDSAMIGEAYSSIAGSYQAVDKFDSSLKYYALSLELSQKLGDKSQAGNTLVNLGAGYLALGKYTIAEQFLKQAKNIAIETKYQELLLEAEHDLAMLYGKMQDYKTGYAYYDSAYRFLDSFRSEEKEKAMAEMTARYNNSELESKNTLLQKENDLELVRLQRKDVLVYAILCGMVLLVVIGWQVMRHNKLAANQKLLQLEQKQLLAQMNPHFIFNCLNSIQQFVVQQDTENANKYLADFALLMRQTLDNSKDGTIPLKREIEYLENYLSLEGMRFENKFKYAVDCRGDVNINTIEIPSMIIQPFVENAIQHGLRNLEDREGVLNIHFYKNQENLFCEVDDNGIGMEESQKLKDQRFIQYQSHGMEMTRQRLALVSKLNSKEYEISVSNKTNADGGSGGTRITIKFPLKA